MARLLAYVRNRFRQHRGETVVETLAAVLVCSFALLVLYTALAAAGRMNAQADSAALNVRQAMLTVQQQNSTGDIRGVAIEGFDEYYQVEYYVSEGGEFATYKAL